MIKTVVFDLGGVYFKRGTHLMLPKLFNLLEAPPDRIREVFTNYRKKEGWLFRRGAISAEEFWERAREKLDLGLKEAEQIKKFWYASYEPIEGMPELVRDLREGGYYVIAFSGNIKERMEFLDQRYGIHNEFDDFVLSFDFGLSKREERFYIILLQSIKCQPQECVCIDDSLRIVKTEQELGLKTIHFKDADQTRSELQKMGVSI
ncbi:MAG: HAD-IA family hydrolase [Candidatus Nealsonbacteria bacterium]|nr:HAD-IA family hydrolase [Candidatus Nealsonbacteria bacterium]